jgi:hypothetical protein
MIFSFSVAPEWIIVPEPPPRVNKTLYGNLGLIVSKS